MNSTSLDQKILRSPCPPELCDCGYYAIVPNRINAVVDSEIAKFDGLTLTKIEEKNIMTDIASIVTIGEFNVLRNILRTQHGIMFLVQGNGGIKVEMARGLCRKTREKVRKAFSSVLSTNQHLLTMILNKDSLFSDEQE